MIFTKATVVYTLRKYGSHKLYSQFNIFFMNYQFVTSTVHTSSKSNGLS